MPWNDSRIELLVVENGISLKTCAEDWGISYSHHYQRNVTHFCACLYEVRTTNIEYYHKVVISHVTNEKAREKVSYETFIQKRNMWEQWNSSVPAAKLFLPLGFGMPLPFKKNLAINLKKVLVLGILCYVEFEIVIFFHSF